MIIDQVSERLGSGSYFDIFSLKAGRGSVALKCPKPHLKHDPRVRRMLDTEARVLAALDGEEHFPRLYGRGEESSLPYLLMEKLRGINLDQALQEDAGKKEPALPSLALGIVLEIAAGLRALHSTSLPKIEKLVHGDLKPHNVMLLNDGRVMLIDLSLEGGTFSYMPPERMDSQIAKTATDLFAAGLILFELLSGTPLFAGESKMEVYFQMRDFRRAPPPFPASIPETSASLIRRCLSAGLEGGYSDADALYEDVSAQVARSSSIPSRLLRSQWMERRKGETLWMKSSQTSTKCSK